MIRTLGASRGQVMRNVVGEALVIGVHRVARRACSPASGSPGASSRLFDAIGFGLPAAGIEVRRARSSPRCWSGVRRDGASPSVGPALRATRVPPIAAVQEGAALPPGRFSRVAPYLAGLLLAGGHRPVRLRPGRRPRRDRGAAGARPRRGARVPRRRRCSPRFIVRPLARVIGAPIEAARRHHRPPRAGQRDPQHRAHRRDRGGADDRRRPGRVRRHLRGRASRSRSPGRSTAPSRAT